MEKISNIVRGSSRVSSTDLKNAPAVRPGTPSYGRPVGESQGSAEKFGTTASRAVALHNELRENHRTAREQQVSTQQMADQFFMTRVRRPEEDVGTAEMQGAEMRSAETPPAMQARGPARSQPASPAEPKVRAEQVSEDDAAPMPTDGTAPPKGFTPRGSYVDVRA